MKSEINNLINQFFSQENYNHPLIKKMLNTKLKNAVIQVGQMNVLRVSKVFDLETKENIFTPDQLKALETVFLPEAFWYSDERVYKLTPKEVFFPKGQFTLIFSSQKKGIKESIDISQLLDKYDKISNDQLSRKPTPNDPDPEESLNHIIAFKLFQLLEEVLLYLNSPEINNYIKNELFNQFLGLDKESA